MSNGLGFNQYAGRYMSKVTDAGGTAIGLLLQQSFENLATFFKLNSYELPQGVWPLYGGNEASHAINMFGEVPITWYGAVTHNANGITGDGTTTTGSTGIVANTMMDPTRWSMGAYVRSNTAVNLWDIGCGLGGVIAAVVQSRNSVGNCVSYYGGLVTATVATADSLGLFMITRGSSVLANTIKDGVNIAGSVSPASTLPTYPVAIMGATGLTYGSKNLAFAFVAPILYSSVVWLALYNAIQAHETVLGRQV